uniref:Uncharacterized protein n=1 Tax=Hyaloperonospora arabidopsidis (strain Emoy2) TaxID=559515 RepID=M4BDM4_HYAAE
MPRDIDVNAVLAVLTDPASTWQHVAVVDPSSMTTSTREARDGPSLAVCNTATCSISVEQWFLNQESVPRQLSSAAHGRATAPVCDRQPNIARKQRLSVRHARAEALVNTNTATEQRPSSRVPELPTTPKQKLPVCRRRAEAPALSKMRTLCRSGGFRSPSRQQWFSRPQSTARPELQCHSAVDGDGPGFDALPGSLILLLPLRSILSALSI